MDGWFVASALALLCMCVSGGALAFLLLALIAALGFRPSRVGPGPRAPMCVMKPLCGLEPLLEEAIRSVLSQGYAGPTRFVFGVHRADDPAAALVRRLVREHPDLDIRLVCDGPARGANRKAANLANMWREAQGEIVVVSDSDAILAPGALEAVAAAMQPADVGAATCLYFGRPARPESLVQRFGAVYLDAWFAPSVLTHALLGGGAGVGYGPLTAIKREVLEAAGGFAALLDCLADDTELGRMARRQGLKVAFADVWAETVVADLDLVDLLRHELRWARTTRALQPVGYAASVVMHPGPLPWLGVALHPSPLSLALALAIPVLRSGLVRVIRRRAGREARGAPSWLLLALREQVYFGVWLAGFFGREVIWRGRRLMISTPKARAFRAERPAPRLEAA